jgi:hypothetical protein
VTATKRFTAFALLTVLLAMMLFSPASFVAGDPTGATIVSNSTEYAPIVAAGSSTTVGGSFTTLLLNATTQTPRWKAYVGNVSGTFTLRDSSNDTIYDWGTASSGGEVYSSRDNSIDWSSLLCANGGAISAGGDCVEYVWE